MRIYKSIILVIVFYITSIVTYAQPTNRALIIAIGAYDVDKTGWDAINSANDIPIVTQQLMDKGFSPNNIAVLKDEQATKDGVKAALYTLQGNASKGDIVYIHYSGHGQQISDMNGDEIDGLDETLVTFNAPSNVSFWPEYKGEEHLNDDEFGLIINQVRQKLGSKGQVIVVMDACHSGTGVRSSGIVRGGKEPFLFSEDETMLLKDKEGSGLYERIENTRSMNEDLAPYVLFSASRPDELNFETVDEHGVNVGSLTYGISLAFNACAPNDNYSKVFASLKETMKTIAPYQTPMIEGDINYNVFSGAFSYQEPYFLIEEMLSNNVARINGGTIAGIHVGDSIALYPSGTHSIIEGGALLTGVVEEVNNFYSIIAFVGFGELNNIELQWVFKTRSTMPDRMFGIFADIQNSALYKVFESSLKNSKFNLKLVINKDQADIIIELDSTSLAKEYTILASKDNYLFSSVPSNIDYEELANVLVNKVDIYLRGQTIAENAYYDANHSIDLELLPVKLDYLANGEPKVDASGIYIVKDTLSIMDYYANGALVFSKDVTFLLKFINNGKNKAFFGVVDIQPDGIINPIYPGKNRLPEECFLEPGATYIPTNFIINGFYPPYGEEKFVVFANDCPINIESVVTSLVKSRAIFTGYDFGLVNEVFKKGSVLIYPFSIREE